MEDIKERLGHYKYNYFFHIYYIKNIKTKFIMHIWIIHFTKS